MQMRPMPTYVAEIRQRPALGYPNFRRILFRAPRAGELRRPKVTGVFRGGGGYVNVES